MEDHWAEGGLGDAVLDALAGTGAKVAKLAVRTMPGSGTPDELLATAGIDADHIVDAARRLAAGHETGEGVEREPNRIPTGPAPATDTAERFPLPEPEGALVWVIVGEASARTGIEPETLRRWRENGTLDSRILSTPDGPKEIVPLQQVEEHAVRRSV